MYGNIFFQFTGNRWEPPYLSHSWIWRDFSCVTYFRIRYLIVSAVFAMKQALALMKK